MLAEQAHKTQESLTKTVHDVEGIATSTASEASKAASEALDREVRPLSYEERFSIRNQSPKCKAMQPRRPGCIRGAMASSCRLRCRGTGTA